MAKMMIL